MPITRKDTKIVELAGRHWLIGELLKAGVEVATPVRDRGVDLIAYLDKDNRRKRFLSVPIQMKAASERSFSLDGKYKAFNNLVLTYVWYVNDSAKTVAYALTFNEALNVSNQMGYTGNPIWKNDGRWAVNKPGIELCKKLVPYLMTTEKWRRLLARQHAAMRRR